MEISSVVGISEIHNSSFEPDPVRFIDRESESIEIYRESKKAESKDQRIAVVVTGTVQSVGFRPFVHQLATQMGLRGFVRNQSSDVYIEAQGSTGALTQFVEDIRRKSPALAHIVSIEVSNRIPRSEDEVLAEFTIKTSEESGNDRSVNPDADPRAASVFVAPDIATCEQCLEELFDPGDRRFHYPFLNCVNCGPRLTIIENRPYDRINTTMKSFTLCNDCEREYKDPSNRRFHAQPTACSRCGPRLRAVEPDQEMGREATDVHEILPKMVEVLARGGILALKSLGGYHLACDAENSAAVKELRRRKGREEKPLAIMVRDTSMARQICHVSRAEASALESRARPIVLLKRRCDCDVDGKAELAFEVSCGSPDVGVLLPYTPLHALLMNEVSGRALVMTSGNESDSPIAWNDEDALKRLAGIADLIVTHDRPIRVRCDDSVLKISSSSPESTSPPLETPILIRRSRGYVPDAVRLPFPVPEAIFAAGSQMKNTFAFAKNEHAVLSHHIGDLDHLRTFDAYAREISLYENLFASRPRVLACDLHPGYMSSRYAEERARTEGSKLIRIQHHHAHVASCMADNGLNGRVIGVAFDGTGYGADGAIWGGEFMVAGYGGFERAAYFQYVPMPGGERAILEPWRMAEAYANRAGVNLDLDGRDRLEVPAAERALLRKVIERGLNCPLTSSVGRLFDAVAALLGLRSHISFDGQAAMEIEWLASGAIGGGSYPIHLVDSEGPITLDPTSMIREILADRASGTDRSVIASRFHSSVAKVVAQVCERIRNKTDLNRVVLSGGVFLNRRLLEETRQNLGEKNFEVFSHRSVPPSDGGLSLGQVAVAAAMIKEANEKGNH